METVKRPVDARACGGQAEYGGFRAVELLCVTPCYVSVIAQSPTPAGGTAPAATRASAADGNQ